ncbi:MAG: 4Fe-4S cluster-binding domain-containing protein [candidate division Zixibacteria bacterium]|nr:4Fe-4S cluster-binding domain-containing protein [candidate division Zixibacteria bacterium]
MKNIHPGIKEMSPRNKNTMLVKLRNDSQWSSWTWQQKLRLHGKHGLTRFFPNIRRKVNEQYIKYIKSYKIEITPYLLSLIDYDSQGNPQKNDPIWKQVSHIDLLSNVKSADYNGVNLNWEMPEEIHYSILHHKYPDRAIIRLTDNCLGYCSYCYLAQRTLDKKRKTLSSSFQIKWNGTLEYLRKNRQIRDILLSGGDPLLFSNRRLDQLFKDIKDIESISTIRINTRALTFNPFRFDPELIRIFKKYGLTALEVHFAHPKEITQEVDDALSLMDDIGYRPIILWRSPLLKGINDSCGILEELLVKLYERRIVPYYLFHYAPYSPARSNLSTSVKKGVRLLSELRRKIPGIAFPRYTLFHSSGKHDIPLVQEGTNEFKYEILANKQYIVKFKNWKDNWVIYPDLQDN